MLEKIQETAAFLKEKMHTNPETAIILGTGLGSLVHEITDKYEISYKDIPNFPVSKHYLYQTLPEELILLLKSVT